MILACSYEASQMHWKNGMAQGFALFSHGAAAGQAIQTINGLVFDDGVVRLSAPCSDPHRQGMALQKGHYNCNTAQGSMTADDTGLFRYHHCILQFWG